MTDFPATIANLNKKLSKHRKFFNLEVKTFALCNGCEYAMVEKIFAGELGCKWPGKIFLQVNS